MQDRYILNDDQVAKLEKIGERLKTRRLELSCSISQAAEITRISAAILLAIEQASYNEFPQLVFLKGFLRNYCQFLEIDSDPIISEIVTIFYDAQDIYTNYKLNEKSYDKQADNFSTILKLASSSFILLAILALGYFGFRYFSQTRISKPVISIAVSEQDPALEDSLTPPPGQVADNTKDLKVVLTALSNGWVSVNVKDETPELINLKKGEQLDWQVEDSIHFKLSRGDLASLMVNGVEEKIPENEYGNIYEITFSN